jgi:hypothetical protein
VKYGLRAGSFKALAVLMLRDAPLRALLSMRICPHPEEG